MSIYIGDKKAKLYRGDYGPAQLYKGDVKIAGYTDVEKVGTQISGVDTYNDKLLPAIDGKSEQTVTVHGKNLLNCARRTDRPDTPSTWNPDTGTLLVNGKWFTAVLITLEPDTDYYFSAIREGATAAGGGAVAIYVATGAAQSDVIILLGARDGTFHTRQAVTEYQIFLYSAYGTQGECTFRNLSVSKGTQPIPYEPFVPNSPSPDYPSPILSSENFDVVSCGRDTAIATTAHVTDPLRSVGNVSDSIEVSNGKVALVRRCATKMFDQSTPVSQNSAGDKKLFYIRLPELRWEMQKYGDGLCTHCKNTYSVNPTTDYLSCSFGAWGPTMYLVYRNDTSVKEIEAYLTQQSTAGTPVTCQYQLATPTRTDITTTPLGQALLAMRTYPHYTQVYTNAMLPPVLRAHIKEMEP